MSAGTYTTIVDILGGQDSTNDWGDPVESTEVRLAGVPASIVERPYFSGVATESSREPVLVHRYVGRVPAGTPVTEADRLRDQATGLIYQVDYVSQPANPALPADVRLDLKRVT